jgi:hypothetical protein
LIETAGTVAQARHTRPIREIETPSDLNRMLVYVLYVSIPYDMQKETIPFLLAPS